jgi:hypothetical protein
MATGASWVTTSTGPAALGATPITAAPIFNGVTVLSTSDSGPSTNCVTASGGVPWTYATCCSTCPTYGSPNQHPSGTYMDAVPDLNAHTATLACTNRTVATGVFGLLLDNTMEYYVR